MTADPYEIWDRVSDDLCFGSACPVFSDNDLPVDLFLKGGNVGDDAYQTVAFGEG